MARSPDLPRANAPTRLAHARAGDDAPARAAARRRLAAAALACGLLAAGCEVAHAAPDPARKAEREAKKAAREPKKAARDPAPTAPAAPATPPPAAAPSTSPRAPTPPPAAGPPLPPCPPDNPLTFRSFGAGFLRTWCTGCHSSTLPERDRQDAPTDVNFDTHAFYLPHARDVYARVVLEAHALAADPKASTSPMPPAGLVPEAELRRVSQWIACGSPIE